MAEHDKPGQSGVADDDLLLVERVLSGDRKAFEPLVRKYERRVFRVTLGVLGNTEDAEEAMQDTFVKAFRHLGQFRRESRFTTWLTRIAINEALQKRKTQKHLISLDESENLERHFLPKRREPWRADPEQLYGKQEVHRLVESAIQALPAIYREAFILRDVEQMTAEEAAEVLGITVAAMKSRLLRARLMLRETLAASFEVPPTFRTKIVDAAEQIRNAVAMKVMRAAGR
jgi:RNA polymerase sigma-70 factor (ECF subfamily)